MLALYRSGRHAEALRAYQDFRCYLVEEIGLEPSADLQRLEADMVRRDRASTWSARTGGVAPTGIIEKPRFRAGR